MTQHPVFLEGAGTSLATVNAHTGSAPVGWIHRVVPKDDFDNGWRIISTADDSEYLSDPANWHRVDYNEMCEIEPILIPLYRFPVGSEFAIVRTESGRIVVFDDSTGQPVPDRELFGE